MSRSYYKLYDLRLIELSKEEYEAWEAIGKISDNNLYIVKHDKGHNLYIGKTKLNVDLSELEGINLDGYATEKWVRDYVANSGGVISGGSTENDITAVVYLNTKKQIGQTIELQDVYPIQDDNTELKIISKNRIKYIEGTQNLNGTTIDVSSNDGITINTDSSAAEVYIPIGQVDIDIPGKYTIRMDGDDFKNDNEWCYIVYELNDSKNKIIREACQISKSEITIDSEELNISTIKFYLFANVNTKKLDGVNFKLYAEYGNTITSATAPQHDANLSGKKINIYSKNLYISGSPDIIDQGIVKVNDIIVENGSELGVHYVHGIMTNNNEINFEANSDTSILKTPLLKGEKFTYMYTISEIDEEGLHIVNPQIVKGHTDYETYSSPELTTVTSDVNGICSIVGIKYPYSFLELENIPENEAHEICLCYDPALSRNWTEKQLADINKRIDEIEVTNPEINLDDYATKNYVDSAISSLPDNTVDLTPYYTATETEEYVNESISSLNAESTTNMVTEFSDTVTHTQYPSAKATKDAIDAAVDAIIATISSVSVKPSILDYLTYRIDAATDSSSIVTITGYSEGIPADIVIPDFIDGYPVTSIGKYAFKGCTSLTSVTIPDSVTSIGNSAFYDCSSLTSIVIPDSVTYIYQNAFKNCTQITNAKISRSLSNTGLDIFSGCTSLTYIEIPNGIKTISERTFVNCSNLKSLTIPASVERIDMAAFNFCDSLTDVYYLGSDADRQNIVIDDANVNLKYAKWHYQTNRSTLKGDVNGDGVINQADLDLLSLYLNTNTIPENTTFYLDNADINDDGIINTVDLNELKQIIAGINDETVTKSYVDNLIDTFIAFGTEDIETAEIPDDAILYLQYEE